MKLIGSHRLAGLALAVALAGGSIAAPALAQDPAAATAPAAAAAPAAPGGVAAAAPAAEAPAAEAPAAAAEAPAPTPDKGDVSWMLLSTLLVLLMILPGLALFYGGLVRQKNMLSMLMQVSTVTVIGMMAWLLWGYSLAFTDGGGLDTFVGGFGRLFFKDVTTSSNVATFSTGVVIPELAFAAFQMTFAAITAALVLGGVAERMKFGAVVVFALLWPLLSYYPMAHMVWWWPGPDAIAAAPTDPIKSGLIWGFGALDFAGGTVVHINAGIAALVGALILGARKGYRTEPMPPHSLTLTFVGAGLLWVGWFGFNAGSNLEANSYAALAMMNTFIATAAAGFSWTVTEWVTRKKASMLGMASGLVAGLVAITPAAGFAGPVGSLFLGLIVSPICVIFCSTIKNALKYDDSLDAFGIHGVGGIVGALATGLLVNPAWGGAGVVDYTTCAADGDISTCDTATYVMSTQVLAQFKAVLVACVWSAVASAIVFFIIKYTLGLRASADAEEEGLDIVEHGERAYHS
ncbi:ammonium transporter [Phenylobacterium deserti]|uniref:Ammonium transporter n=1 Tax=Phenylobacterium deserti TaxID=1914756 RepID=A0A328AFV7_9CAUL|nr:ammonium transporter [Phenylobacterium deserti]RAK52304.1 ammonia channel protein [Phenylobacterium deserti]